MSTIANITEQLSATSISSPPPPDSVPFKPQSSLRWKNLHLDPIPRYLFRVYTPRSDGYTDDQWCRSRDAVNNQPNAKRDIFQTRDRHTTAEDIAGHLLWNGYKRHDNLMSWTSSLLFALQYMFYRHSRDPSPMQDIRLCMVDTSYLGTQYFVRDMDLIAAFLPHDRSKALDGLRKMRTGGTHYYGEYLSQGALRIEGACASEPAQELIDLGLLDLQPEFRWAYENGTKEWAKPVVRTRETLEERTEARLSVEQLRSVVRITERFDTLFRLPMTIHLIALLPGRLDLNLITKIVRGEGKFSGGCPIKRVDFTSPELER